MKWILSLFVFLPLVAITSVTPYITRRTESFGVSIPRSVYGSPELKAFRKQYAMITGCLGPLFFVPLLILKIPEEVFPLVFAGAVFGYLSAGFIVYYLYHKKMKRLKRSRNWKGERKEAVALDIRFHQRKRTVSYRWFLLPLAITGASFICTALFYDRIPDPVPMHYDMNGEVNRWAEKTPGSVSLLPLVSLFMTGLFMLVNWIIDQSKQQIDADDPEKSLEQNLIFRRRWSGFIIFSGTLLVLMFFLAQLSLIFSYGQKAVFLLMMTAVGLTLVGCLVLTILTGQGGSRIHGIGENDGGLINRDDDRFWKLGVFYCNPEDPALFLEKRFGSGWTINFARPAAWLLFLGVLLIPVIIAIFAG